MIMKFVGLLAEKMLLIIFFRSSGFISFCSGVMSLCGVLLGVSLGRGVLVRGCGLFYFSSVVVVGIREMELLSNGVDLLLMGLNDVSCVLLSISLLISLSSFLWSLWDLCLCRC